MGEREQQLENAVRNLIWCHQQPPSHRCGFLADAKALLGEGDNGG